MLIGWRLRGIDVSFIPLDWGDQDELAEAKYRRVVERIEQFKDRDIVLIGESAGGSMALRVLLESDMKLSQVVTVCGYNHGAKYVGKRHREVHPAFIPTVEKVDKLLGSLGADDRSSITNYYSPSDGVVDFERTKVKGAKLVKLPSLVHAAAIGYFLLTTSIKGFK